MVEWLKKFKKGFLTVVFQKAASTFMMFKIAQHKGVLCKAFGQMHWKVAKFALKHGANPNVLYYNNNSLLSTASCFRFVEIVDVLVKHGADVNRLHDGRSPLYYAGSHVDIVSTLLEHGADPNLGDDYYHKPLPNLVHYFEISDKKATISAVQKLVEHGADVNERFCYFRSVFFDAISTKNADLVQVFLDSPNLSIDPKDMYFFETLLTSYSPAVFKACMQKLPSLEEVYGYQYCSSCSETPLCIAVRSGIPSAVKVLVDLGADVNALSSEGLTPLMVAVQKKSAESVQILLQSPNFDGLKENKKGQTAYEYAVEQWGEDSEFASQLKRVCARPNTIDWLLNQARLDQEKRLKDKEGALAFEGGMVCSAPFLLDAQTHSFTTQKMWQNVVGLGCERAPLSLKEELQTSSRMPVSNVVEKEVLLPVQSPQKSFVTRHSTKKMWRSIHTQQKEK